MTRVLLKTYYDLMIDEISRKHGNNPHLVKAFIKVESNFKPKAHRKTSREDSRGLGQINKSTCISLAGDPDRLFDPEYNIEIMNRLITDLKLRYDNTLDLISAYNAGRPLMAKTGYYVNSAYVLNVYSRFIAYSILEI